MAKSREAAVSVPSAREIAEVTSQMSGVNFWKCVTFADTVKRYCEITMNQDNVSPLHSIAMNHLVCAGGKSTPTKLAELMFRSKHSVTKIVDTLEKLGFIVRDFSSKDRRVTHIMVTHAGLDYVRTNQCKGNRRARQVIDCLTDKEQETLIGLTNKLNDQMTDILNRL
jgi:DNA-binding MarR family transcriptional regulator